MPKKRTPERVGQLELIRRWRWTAQTFRRRAIKILDDQNLWGATEALTLDARAWVLEQCARDLWRHIQGREVWPESAEIREMREALESVQEKFKEVQAETDLRAQMHAVEREIEERD